MLVGAFVLHRIWERFRWVTLFIGHSVPVRSIDEHTFVAYSILLGKACRTAVTLSLLFVTACQASGRSVHRGAQETPRIRAEN
jgi:hypothetical protein